MSDHPGFLPIHRGGLTVCRKPGDRLALMWLTEQGAVVGWGNPFEATNGELCEASGLGRGWVRGFLRRMAQAGVLLVAVTGDKQTSREVAMSTPFPSKVIHGSDHDLDHDSDHDDPDDDDGVEANDSRVGPRPGPRQRTSRERDLRSDLKISGSERDPGLALAFLGAMDEWSDHHSRDRLKGNTRVKASGKWLDLCGDFPDIDHNEEVRKAQAWAVTNPKKTPKNGLLFLRNWFGRAKPKPSGKNGQPHPLAHNGASFSLWLELMKNKNWSNPRRMQPPDRLPDDGRWRLHEDPGEHDKRRRAMVAAGGWTKRCDFTHPAHEAMYRKALDEAYRTDSGGAR